jgi:hypothetical protein
VQPSIPVENVTIESRVGSRLGLRSGRVAAYNHWIETRHPVRQGASRVMRFFLLLDEAIQICQPPTWFGHDAGAWYVDLVSIVERGDVIEVTDLDIDVIVPSAGHPYRIVDLHEFGDAIESGEHSLPDAITGLRNMQAFLDSHLNRSGGGPGDWPDFPPAAIAPLRDVPLPLPPGAETG